MQPKHVAISIGVFAIALSAVVSAQQVGSGALMPEFSCKPRQKPAAPPYVFRMPAVPITTPKETAGAAGKPTVLCGMTLIPADPGFDAAMRKRAPDTATSFTIARIQPRACTRARDERSRGSVAAVGVESDCGSYGLTARRGKSR